MLEQSETAGISESGAVQIAMCSKLNRIAVLVASAFVVCHAQAGGIAIKGSDTLVILAQKWAEVYMRTNPAIRIQVTGGGSGIGFAALQNNTTDLAIVSRRIKRTERMACIRAFYRDPREYKVALDGLLVYVNGANPVNELSLPQIKNVFTGMVQSWKELGGGDAPITVYSRENSSGTYAFLKEYVLNGQDFSARVQTMPGTAALLQAVIRDRNGIGYGGAAYGHGAKPLRLKPTADAAAIQPSEETILNGKYPIWRYLYVYLNPEKDQGQVAAFLNWVRSDAGQAIVKDLGFFPLQQELRYQ
jgi:phosphate transport system substrate-binding protein